MSAQEQNRRKPGAKEWVVLLESGLNSRPARPRPDQSAFTLIELMVVVGIIGMVLAMGAPTLYRFFHKEGFRKAVSDVKEACNTARSRAIMSGEMATLIVNSQEGGTTRFHVQAGGKAGWGGEVLDESLPDNIAIEKLRVNGADAMGLDRIQIRFFPDGRCDEMELVLWNNKTNERRKISLELTTSLASVEMDPNNWR